MFQKATTTKSKNTEKSNLTLDQMIKGAIDALILLEDRDFGVLVEMPNADAMLLLACRAELGKNPAQVPEEVVLATVRNLLEQAIAEEAAYYNEEAEAFAFARMNEL